MLFREFLLQNDFQVPLAWGEGGDFETMDVRDLAQSNLNDMETHLPLCCCDTLRGSHPNFP